MGIPVETEEQKRARHERLFRRLDVDGTGEIRYETLKRAFEREDHPLKDNKEAIEAIFKSLDCNKDSVIDFGDFEAYVSVAEVQIRRGFDKIDVDADGKIKAEELSNYLRDLGEDVRQEVDAEAPKGNRLTKFIQWAFLRRKEEEAVGNSCNSSSGNNARAAARTASSQPPSRVPSPSPSYITYDQWRDFLIFMPRKEGSRLHTAYSYFYLFNEDVDLSSEGDMTLITDFIGGFGFFLAGGFSGVISRTCTAPFDRIKVFLIARTDLSSTLLNSKEKLLYNNPRADLSKIRSPLVKAAQSLYRQGGLRAFYVGNGLNVFKVFPESAMKFGSFELAKRLLVQLEGVHDTSQLSKFSTYIAGGLGGIAAQFFVYPIDTLKFRVQCAPLNTTLKGMPLLTKTAGEMYREGGLRLFYRGLGVGIMGVFPYAALDLGTFSALKKWYIAKKAKTLGIPETDVVISNFVVLPMGAFSGTVGATVVYPINLLRTRLQAQGTFAHPHRYDGFKDVFLKTIQREGFPGLYKGLIPTLAKVCPAVSISYLCYENLKRGMKLE
ncbi:Ca(2+)-binding ATP:ADP antiporter SAL1 Ecym_5377 [Eremothecium cymbalariae DBVPG|uniref:EF-hand domain-containing protein n=1 Tax=Eremothecium cymbalariae (strain CBS 270.75 / DBVPG 7215 / KCTC 17166 / NRRL Y-17582) TaxID=931890 RepID=I6NDJ0_ERECY|nr:hypothetical protein Ecym_5377 [Eremothecium cymbalariae DBVPG\